MKKKNKTVLKEDERVDSWEDLTDKEKDNVSTKDEASSIALSQLLQLRKRVIGDWEADWMFNIDKYVIRRFENNLKLDDTYGRYEELSFPTAEMRDKFLKKYKALIEVYFKIK